MLHTQQHQHRAKLVLLLCCAAAAAAAAAAGSYDYLERFVAEFDSSHSLALLPNYAFALPLARFRLEQQQQQAGGGSEQPGSSSSSSKASAVSSYTLLAQALLLHPRVLVELMAKLGGQGVGKDAAWQSLLGRKLFAKVRRAAAGAAAALCLATSGKLLCVHQD
jgi:hypothetical protein